MIPLTITPNIEQTPWAELTGIDLTEVTLEKVGLLPRGTASGQPVVMLQLRAADGQVLISQTTLKLFRTAARAILATPLAQEWEE